jgi:DNA mismatch repair protein MutS2
MREKIFTFLKENNITLFESKSLPCINPSFKTKDAAKVYTKIITSLRSLCSTKAGSQLLSFFQNEKDLNEKQRFFQSLMEKEKKSEYSSNTFLKKIKEPNISWRPEYSIIIATEDEDIYMELRKEKIPVIHLANPSEIEELKSYDLVQYHECDRFVTLLEEIPKSIQIKNKEDIYVERNLIALSSWINIINLLGENQAYDSFPSLQKIVPLLPFIEKKEKITICKEDIERILEDINENIKTKLKDLILSGESIVAILQSKELPKEVKNLIYEEIRNTNLPYELFIDTFPVEIDYDSLDNIIKGQESSTFIDSAMHILKNKETIKMIPVLLEQLEQEIIIFDFECAMQRYLKDKEMLMPIVTQQFRINDCKNLFIKNAQPISFMLNDIYKCSMLTGANSGGKTTLIEHIIQLITLTTLGLPVQGKFMTPLFDEIYYFAKNKGSMNKGAFETLLTQMSKVRTNKKTLILADEIEAVTEPSVAGKIISATADYFIKQGAYSIFATHLGNELIKSLPEGARIDGIEAKGLSEKNELIIDHNPVMGKLANSTPELIIERLAKVKKHAYFENLYNSIQQNKDERINSEKNIISLTP